MGPPAINLDIPFPSRAIFLPSGQLCRSGWHIRCRGCLSLSIGSQWIRYLPDQGHRSRWSRQLLISDTPFPSRAIFWPSGHDSECRSGGTYRCRGCLSLSIGSQWIRYLPDQSDGSRWSRQRLFRNGPFPSRAIFWPSGHPEPIRGISDAGAAYLYQLEANGSATYLTKVTAPDGAASDYFGTSVSQSGNILAVGAWKANPGGEDDAGAAYLYQLEANGSATFLTKVTAPDGVLPAIISEIRFPVGQYFGRRGMECRSGGDFPMPGRSIPLIFQPIPIPTIHLRI